MLEDRDLDKIRHDTSTKQTRPLMLEDGDSDTTNMTCTLVCNRTFPTPYSIQPSFLHPDISEVLCDYMGYGETNLM